MRIELIHRGGAHTPGDVLVWLPGHSIVFVGDTVFMQRLLGIVQLQCEPNFSPEGLASRAHAE